ncbi:MAG: shikimate kinase [bacterium]
MNKCTNIFLTGMMGSGKSSIGRCAAEMLRLTFVDTDELIESRLGRTITELYREPGEEFFREQEEILLAELVHEDRQVIATGGGMLANAANLNLAQVSGLVVYLKAPVEVLVRRLETQSDRPLLAGSDQAAQLAQLLDLRREYYESADVTIDVSALGIKQAAMALSEEYRKWLTD